MLSNFCKPLVLLVFRATVSRFANPFKRHSPSSCLSIQSSHQLLALNPRPAQLSRHRYIPREISLHQHQIRPLPHLNHATITQAHVMAGRDVAARNVSRGLSPAPINNSSSRCSDDPNGTCAGVRARKNRHRDRVQERDAGVRCCEGNMRVPSSSCYCFCDG